MKININFQYTKKKIKPLEMHVFVRQILCKYFFFYFFTYRNCNRIIIERKSRQNRIFILLLFQFVNFFYISISKGCLNWYFICICLVTLSSNFTSEFSNNTKSPFYYSKIFLSKTHLHISEQKAEKFISIELIKRKSDLLLWSLIYHCALQIIWNHRKIIIVTWS